MLIPSKQKLQISIETLKTSKSNINRIQRTDKSSERHRNQPKVTQTAL